MSSLVPASRSQYEYKLLSSPTAVRVIKIVPELVDGLHISCIIHNSSHLPDTAEYQALSYLWGDSTPSRHIGLKDGNAPGAQWQLYGLHENLWHFLDHLRTKEMFDRFFWTYHLCLNQEDTDEMAR